MAAILEVAHPDQAQPPHRDPTCLASAGALIVRVAQSDTELQGAFRLRHAVFSRDPGARTEANRDLDRDVFDDYCLHLVVIDTTIERVVGTYRVLMPERARALGCMYTDSEFWLTRLAHLRDGMVELGRACVHPDYRSGATMLLLWTGLGAMLSCSAYRQLIGCVSVPVADGGVLAANLYRQLSKTHLAEEPLRVWPRRRLCIESMPDTGVAVPPPLMKAYLRAGARLLGEPHLDEALGCADFPMMLDLAGLGSRHRRRFLQ